MAAGPRSATAPANARGQVLAAGTAVAVSRSSAGFEPATSPLARACSIQAELRAAIDRNDHKLLLGQASFGKCGLSVDGATGLRDADGVKLSEWHMWWKAAGHQGLSQQLMLWWDPIGVKDIPEAQGEYDGYAGRLGRMLREGKTEQELAALLSDAEAGMGMRPRPELDAFVAAKLIDWFAAAMRELERAS